MHTAQFETPVERLKHWATEQPDVVYLTQPINNQSIEYTWSEVLDEVTRVANYLSKYPKSSHIAVISLNCAHWIMADLAIQMAGHISIPIYPTASANTVSKILRHSESKAVFLGKMFDSESATRLLNKAIGDLDIEALAIYQSYPDMPYWQQIVSEYSPIKLACQNQENDLLSIIYTSGTTGDPKGVMISYRAVQASMDLVKSVVVINQQDRFVSYLPLAHVAERMAVEFSALYAGAHVSFIRSLETFTDDVKTARPTIFFGVPRIWAKIQSAIESKLGGPRLLRGLFRVPVVGNKLKKVLLNKLGFQNVRYALCAAAAVNKAVLQWFGDLGLKLNEAYGMSETCGLSHMTLQTDTKMGSVGRVIEGCECQLSTTGEVLLRNPAMMNGYYKQAELTAQTIDSDGWLHTGDLGVIDADGFLYIIGRVKDIFKTSKGKYIAPIPIEQKFQTALGIEHVILMGNGLTQPVLVVSTFESSYVNDSQKLIVKCQQQLNVINSDLEVHERLSHIFITAHPWTSENGLLTPTLKMKRNNIEKHHLNSIEALMNASTEQVLMLQ